MAASCTEERQHSDVPQGRVDPVRCLDREELRILSLLAAGFTFDSVARRLGISARTARRRMRDLCEEWGVGSTVEAIVVAVRQGLV